MLYKGMGAVSFYTEVIGYGKDRMSSRHEGLLKDFKQMYSLPPQL
jgi:hypothetical protein